MGKSLRDYLQLLEKERPNELKVVPRAVDPLRSTARRARSGLARTRSSSHRQRTPYLPRGSTSGGRAPRGSWDPSHGCACT